MGMKEIQTSGDIPEIVRIAEDVAREAGAYLLQKLGTAKVEYRKSLRDDVLDADLHAEQLIITRLRVPFNVKIPNQYQFIATQISIEV